MTGPASTDRSHLSAETVAELDDGVLDAREALAAQAHLLDCRRCSGLRARLSEVSGLLAGHGEVGPLPPDVAARLDEALAAEAPAAEAPAGPAERPTPATTARTVLEHTPRPPFGMRMLQVAAVLVVLVAGVGIGVGALRGGSEDAGTTASGAADNAGSGEKSAPAGSFPVTASGRNWSPDSVVAAVPRLVAGSLPSAVELRASQQEDAGGEAPELTARDSARLAGGPPLAECVTALNDGPVTPLAVDLASWQGQPAAVVVLPTPDDPATVDTWVVAPDCSQADAKVLYFARVARP